MRIVNWALLLYIVLCYAFTQFLWLFHCRLIQQNSSTFEYLKYKDKTRNYRHRGFCGRQLFYALCRKRPASYVPNSLVKISLAIEENLGREQFSQATGGTPRRTDNNNRATRSLQRAFTYDQR